MPHEIALCTEMAMRLARGWCVEIKQNQRLRRILSYQHNTTAWCISKYRRGMCRRHSRGKYVIVKFANCELLTSDMDHLSADTLLDDVTRNGSILFVSSFYIIFGNIHEAPGVGINILCVDIITFQNEFITLDTYFTSKNPTM